MMEDRFSLDKDTILQIQEDKLVAINKNNVLIFSKEASILFQYLIYQNIELEIKKEDKKNFNLTINILKNNKLIHKKVLKKNKNTKKFLNYKPIRLFINKKYNNNISLKHIREYNQNKISFPISIIIEVTQKCNLGCKHCYIEGNKEDAPLKIIKKITNKLVSNGVQKVILIGGEVTLHKDFLRILQFIKKKDVKLRIFTNGYNLSHSHFKAISENCDEVFLSIDKCHLKFNEYQNVIDKFKKYDIKLGTFTVIDNRNIFETIKWVYFIIRNKIPRSYIIFLYPFKKKICMKLEKPTSSKILIYNLLITFLKITKKFGLHKTNFEQGTCQGYKGLYINEIGNIFFCSMMPERYMLGNIFHQTLFDLFISKNFNNLYNKNLFENPCKSCLFLANCTSICLAQNVDINNKLFSGNNYCLRGKISQIIKK